MLWTLAKPPLGSPTHPLIGPHLHPSFLPLNKLNTCYVQSTVLNMNDTELSKLDKRKECHDQSVVSTKGSGSSRSLFHAPFFKRHF